MEFEQVLRTLTRLGNHCEQCLHSNDDMQDWYMLHAQQIYNWWVGVACKGSNLKYLYVEIKAEV